MFKKFISRKIFIVLIFVCATASVNLAQTTEFTYQGKLTDTGMPTATYDFDFHLCASLAADCSAPLATQQITGVPVSSGVFTVKLNFPAANFDGADRFLEIAVKRPAQGTFTTLDPRQKITSAPYAITSSDSLKLGGVLANQFVQTTDPRLTDDRNPLPNSPYYIQNTTTQQTGDFNLSGSGTLGGNGIIGGSLGVGVTSPESGYRLDVSGAGVFRSANGRINFGTPSGETGMTITGTNRADIRFDGTTLKLLAGTGTAAMASTNGININRLGNVGIGTTTPGNKLDVAGNIGSSGSLNVGTSAVISGGLSVGNGINVSNGLSVNSGNLSASSDATITGSLNVGNGGTIGNGLIVSSGNLNVSGAGANLNVASGITLGFVPSGGDFTLCYKNSTKAIANCSASSLRYKRDVQTLKDGLSIVNRLRPVRFNWKDDGRSDLGFAAEEVERVEPLLTFRNERGEVEGVKYQLVGVVLVEAVKQLQEQIEQQNQQIERQRQQIDALTKLVCSQNQQAEICKEKQNEKQ